VTFMTAELMGKRLDLLRELVPQAITVGFLADPQNPTFDQQTGDALAAARVLGQDVIVLEARSDHDFEAVFANLIQRRAPAHRRCLFALHQQSR
jgi:putative ABC transport system substrate-binding protein